MPEWNILVDFYRTMVCRGHYCYGKSSVRPFVCPSVCDIGVYGHI